MSRNFELLQRAEVEDLFTPAGLPPPVPQPAPSPAVTKGPAADEIANLVQRLFFRGGQPGGPRVVSFSGIVHDDRSSWICARAGESLASQTDISVCMVDANFSSPQLHTHFAARNRTGLAAALTTEGPIRKLCNTTLQWESLAATFR